MLKPIAIAALATTACGKHASVQHDFDPWDPDGRARAIEGVWRNDHFVIEIAPDRVRWQFGTGKVAADWRDVLSRTPCSLMWGEQKQSGAMSGAAVTYVKKGGAFYFPAGATGIRNGDRAIACAGGQSVWTLDGSKCTEHFQSYDGWSSSDGACGLGRDGEHDFFYVVDAIGLRMLHVDGDAMWEGDLGAPAEKLAAFDGARPVDAPPGAPPARSLDPSMASGLARVARDDRRWGNRAVSVHGMYVADMMANDALFHGQGSTARYTVALVSGGGDWDVLYCQPDEAQKDLHAGDRVIADGAVQAIEAPFALVGHCKLRRE